MDESEYRKIGRRYNIVGCVVVLTPCLLLALFFNFHTWIADLSGTYKFICVDFHDSKILYYALPKLSNQCGYISVVRQFDIVPPVHWDLIIALDLAILAVPFLTSIYFIIDYKAQRLVMIQPYLRRASGIKYYRVRLTVYLLVGLSTSCWFVLFAPIEVSMPIEVSTSSGILADLADLADYGLGVLFPSLTAALLPHFVTLAVSVVPLLTNRGIRLQSTMDDGTGRS